MHLDWPRENYWESLPPPSTSRYHSLQGCGMIFLWTEFASLSNNFAWPHSWKETLSKIYQHYTVHHSTILQTFLTAAVPRVRAVNDLAVSLSNWDGIKNLQEEHRSLMRRCLSAFAGNYVFSLFQTSSSYERSFLILGRWSESSTDWINAHQRERGSFCRIVMDFCMVMFWQSSIWLYWFAGLTMVLTTHKICPFLLDVEGNHSTFSYFSTLATIFHKGLRLDLKSYQ